MSLFPVDPVLHVYSPTKPGEEIVIVGNYEGLKRLCSSIMAILPPEDAIEFNLGNTVFHSDGVESEIVVVKREVTELLALPYTDPFAKANSSFSGQLEPEDILESIAATEEEKDVTSFYYRG